MEFDALIKPGLWLYKVIELKMEYHQIIHIFTSEGNSLKSLSIILPVIIKREFYYLHQQDDY